MELLLVNVRTRKEGIMTIEELAKETGKSKVVIYKVAKRLGRIPTVEEIMNRQVGRPKKYY
jgi:response regulator of citrate/malate metabolism